MDVSRRALLRGRIAEANNCRSQALVSPPWFIADAAQAGDCSECNACVDACPTSIIEHNDDGIAGINFHKGECELCGDCADVCPKGFFDTPADSKPWNLKAELNEKCLSQQGVVCQTCKEMCPEEAISLKLAIGQVPRPVIDENRCTGCGACFAPCPTKAIDIVSAHHGAESLSIIASETTRTAPVTQSTPITQNAQTLKEHAQ
ncbi:MAG: ferredoxin-type protein NapF [Cellvibrionaceae bacterium]|nr:ferredoxin-type protein NapF [Cellvibrionaceae bacterium]MAZ88698.1 ferredoxin-type protein NapF [Cellvibrionaceae bacterium]|tara:strand:- start:9161 stop:9772 length:612 start_codon:yes stop_codon:yes gene_type:complete